MILDKLQCHYRQKVETSTDEFGLGLLEAFVADLDMMAVFMLNMKSLG